MGRLCNACPILVSRRSFSDGRIYRSVPKGVIERAIVIFVPAVLRIIVSMNTHCAGLGKRSWHDAFGYEVRGHGSPVTFYLYIFSRNTIPTLAWILTAQAQENVLSIPSLATRLVRQDRSACSRRILPATRPIHVLQCFPGTSYHVGMNTRCAGLRQHPWLQGSCNGIGVFALGAVCLQKTRM